MSRLRLRDVLFALALLGAVVYFRRRERTITESLTRSQAWATRGTVGEADAGATAGVGDGAAAAANGGAAGSAGADADSTALARAASVLGSSSEAVPERVEALDRKVRELTTDLEKSRAAWAERWWDARTTSPPPADEPHVSLLAVEGGVLADAEAIAKQSLADPLGVAIVLAPDDGTLAVAVGEDLEERADEIAREIATEAGGGAGGDASLATGGGEGDRLRAAAETVRDRLVEHGFES